MSRIHPHGPSLVGMLRALFTVAMILTVWCVAVWVIWAWPPHPVRTWFGS